MFSKQKFILSIFILFAASIHSSTSFTLTSQTTTRNSSSLQIKNRLSDNSRIQLRAFIEADAADVEVFDEGSGGVRLAKESAILLAGTVNTKNNNNPDATDFKRYNKVTSLNDVDSNMILCKGMGMEEYKDPGLSTEKIVSLAPLEAVKNAIQSSSNISIPSGTKHISINFLGGDDLMVHEVFQGIQILVDNLASVLPSPVTVGFRSLCYKDFPLEQCGVVAVALTEINNSDIYWNDGKWWTVSENDLNTDL